jgi:hypothetical protein
MTAYGAEQPFFVIVVGCFLQTFARWIRTLRLASAHRRLPDKLRIMPRQFRLCDRGSNMTGIGFSVSAILIAATVLSACKSDRAPAASAADAARSMCRYEVQSGVPGGAVVAALAPHGGYSCADGDRVSVFVVATTDECPVLPIKTTAAVRIDLSEGSMLLRSCNALASPERPRSGDVLLARVDALSAVDELESAARQGGYFVTYYLRENDLHCFEVSDAEKARAAGLVRLTERFAGPEGLTWTSGTCRQAVRKTLGREFSWRSGH